MEGEGWRGKVRDGGGRLGMEGGEGWRVEGEGWRVEGKGWRVEGEGWRGKGRDGGGRVRGGGWKRLEGKVMEGRMTGVICKPEPESEFPIL